MRILSFGNVGNFQTGYKDGIVVLTRLRGLLTTSVSQVSYDLQMKTWHNSSTLFLYTCFPEGLGKTLKNSNTMKNSIFLVLLSCFGFLSAKAETTLNQDEQNTTLYRPTVEDHFTYKLFPTENMWIFIKLNTRNGQLWLVQFSLDEDNRGEFYLGLPIINDADGTNGRFTLYPTQNMYNFILLDQINGQTWQVQWSIDIDNRFVIPIPSEN